MQENANFLLVFCTKILHESWSNKENSITLRARKKDKVVDYGEKIVVSEVMPLALTLGSSRVAPRPAR